MTGIAFASLRYRWGAFAASFLSVFIGSAVVMGFAAMLDTASQSGVLDADRTTLTIIASVVGGWGAVIVASSLAAMSAVAIRQRAGELALLRSVGASPRQVVRLIMRENWIVAGVAAVSALPVGYGGGRLLLAMLQHTHQVAADIGYRFGVAALGMGLGIALAASMIAARLTVGRAASRRVRDALFAAAAGGRQVGRVRFWSGLIFVGLGLQNAILTMTVFRDGSINTLQTVASQACLLAGIGFALLGPTLLGLVTAELAPLVRLVGRVSGQLVPAAVGQRLQQAATPMMPVIVVTSAATGTLYMQAITNSQHVVPNSGDKSVETLNYVIVGVVMIFAAVMLVNLLAVTIGDRRREFAQQRLIGATPRQLFELVGVESALILAVGLVFGTIGGLLTIVPFSFATTHRLIPHEPIGIYLGVVAAVCALTIGTALHMTRRNIRVEALAVLRAARQ